jgi:hypothetical protein
MNSWLLPVLFPSRIGWILSQGVRMGYGRAYHHRNLQQKTRP